MELSVVPLSLVPLAFVELGPAPGRPDRLPDPTEGPAGRPLLRHERPPSRDDAGGVPADAGHVGEGDPAADPILRLARSQASREAFRSVVRAAFAQRRKSLRNSLAPLAGGSTETIEARLSAAGVDPSSRPERLTVEGFVAVTQALEED